MTNMAANQLRTADIIVSTTGATVSGAIRAGTGSSVSHSMLYIGNQFVVEAIASGVIKRPLTQAIRDASLAIALRRRNTTPGIRSAVVRQAELYARRGLPYDEIGAGRVRYRDQPRPRARHHRLQLELDRLWRRSFRRCSQCQPQPGRQGLFLL